MLFAFQKQVTDKVTDNAEKHVTNEADEVDKDPTAPPESTFKKLAPNENRYTLLHRDEL